MIDNLLTAMAELPASSTPKSIVLKVAELERERDQVEAKLKELQAFQGEGSPVINMEHAFRLFRLFDRNFQKCPAHQQRRALQELVRRIVIKETEICVEYYAAPAPKEGPREASSGPDGDVLDLNRIDPKTVWTPVRSVYQMVVPPGIEPGTAL